MESSTLVSIYAQTPEVFDEARRVLTELCEGLPSMTWRPDPSAESVPVALQARFAGNVADEIRRRLAEMTTLEFQVGEDDEDDE